MTVVQQADLQLNRRLQNDSIKIADKVIYINPFLYWRRFDSNTDRWLREPGQLTEEQIAMNRGRFYPELDWNYLEDDQAAVKDGAVEMFLKTLDLISTYHPELNASHMLEIERKMAVTKKLAFERWVDKTFRRRSSQLRRERQRFARERFIRSWREWVGLETTQQAFVPFMASLIFAGCLGWSIGISNNSCTPFFAPNQQNVIK